MRPGKVTRVEVRISLNVERLVLYLLIAILLFLGL